MSQIVQERQTLPWLQPELLFQLFPQGKSQKRCLAILHGFTDRVRFVIDNLTYFTIQYTLELCLLIVQVIRERKAEHKKRKAQEEKNNASTKKEDDEFMTSPCFIL